MKKLFILLALMLFTAVQMFGQTPYAYYPYYNAGTQTAFEVPTDKVDADLDATTNRASFVMLGSWFDQTNLGGVPSYSTDDGVTIIKDATEGAADFIPTATDDRIVSDTTTVTTHAKWNYTGDYFDRRGQTLFYTVNFSAANDYKIYLRQRKNIGITYTVDVYSKANMDTPIKTFGLTGTDTEYVTAAGVDSHWFKTLEALTIASPGDYVIKIKTTKSFGYNFGGFTIFPVPVSASAEVSITKPVAPGAAVVVNTTATLKALATPAGSNTITKVEFFEGVNLLGEGALVGGFYELAWMPTATGSYVISAKLTESDASETTSTTISNLEVVNSLAYVSRTAWTDTIQAEDYDLGGSEYGAFYDKSAVASGAVSGYRTDNTDTKPGPLGQNVQLGNGGTGWSVGYTAVGETLNYTIKDVPTGTITFSVNYATPNSTAQLKVKLNGEVLATMDAPSTTDWNIFLDATLGGISVTGDADSDDDVLTLEFVGSGSNLDYFSIAEEIATQTLQVKASTLEVYPNPSQGTFSINSGSDAVSTYRIVSLNGQEIESGHFVGQTQLTLNTVKGIYILETKTMDNTSVKKLVVN